ncbi:hypothetical protein GOV14_04125 [Candidatus Pacearchaeota archaeon]|nr:hypothetical protein [Candidatus Pacearchaeota archaeon]
MITKTSNNQAIITGLEDLSKRCPNIVIAHMNKGDLVKKAADFYYEIDNPNIAEQFKSADNRVGLDNIYRHFNTNPSKTRQTFLQTQEINGKRTVPYSEVFNQKHGECLEMAIAFQLAAQDHPDEKCFTVAGSCGFEKDDFGWTHAYNIATKKGKLFLIDVANPISRKSQATKGRLTKMKHYIVPVTDISDMGEIIVPNEFEIGRTYNVGFL